MSAVVEHQRSKHSRAGAGLDAPRPAGTTVDADATPAPKPSTEANDVRESLSRLSLSPSPTLIFEVDAGGPADSSAPPRRWDVRLVGSVRNRGRRPESGAETPAEEMSAATEVSAANEVSAVLIIRAMTPPALLAAIRSMTRGGAPVPPDLMSQMMPRGEHGASARPEELTDRELVVLRMLADGLTTREISEDLSYSERTVKSVVAQALDKLNCQTRAHAVAIATRHGLI